MPEVQARAVHSEQYITCAIVSLSKNALLMNDVFFTRNVHKRPYRRKAAREQFSESGLIRASGLTDNSGYI